MYDVLKRKLEEFSGDAKKAFLEPIYMPSASGRGPRINAITVATNEKSGEFVRGQGEKRRGFASNGRMVRIDIFRKGKQHYVVPIYVQQLVSGCLPNKAVSGKSEKRWIEMDGSYEFIYSVYANQYIQITYKDKQVEGYYVDFDRNRGSVNLCLHNSRRPRPDLRFSIRNAVEIKKYQIDYFGNRYLVKKEVRNGLENSCRIESSKAEFEKSSTLNSRGE